MSHTNGIYGVQAAVEAGVDSLEHGNYMDEETLSMLADSHTVWVPTLVTVRNLLGCGRYEDEVLLPIIRQAETMVRTAFRKKIKVALGSDAGAYCVPHGKGICQEYQSFQEILGDSDEVREWKTEKRSSGKNSDEVKIIEIKNAIILRKMMILRVMAFLCAVYICGSRI